MDVFNKLRSTVSSTVSSLSGVLPGNPVTREFEATSHICSAGPGLLWKVYAGYKNSTKQEASIFVFDKKLLEKWPRESRESILESLKRGVTQLTKLRHPQILTVQHPLEESRDSLAFATEPVYASLANVLGNHENLPAGPKDFKLFDVELKYGLHQIGEGLAFLHNDVKLVHNNLCPESIVLNQQGAWKIFGFDFCIHHDGKAETPSWKGLEHSPYLPHVAQPNLDYLAPEAGLANTRSPACDMFSLGVVIHAMHYEGSTPISFQNDFSTYKRRIKEMTNLPIIKLNKIPDGLRDVAKMLLSFTAELRPDAHQFRKINYFEDVGVKTLNYLDSLFQWDKLQKSKFYKGLSPIIEKFPHRVCLNRVVPCLVKEFANPAMVPFVLPVVLQIAEKSTREEYMSHVFPHLQSAMKLTDPIQILLIFMQKMELLLKLTPQDQVKSDVLPMLYRALDSDAQQIQELCLSVIPTYAALIDYPAMKNALLPRIKKLCINTPYLSVRVNCLVCVGKLLEHLDKWIVLDEVLPFLQQIPSREPAVIMAILGILQISLTHKKLGIPKEVLATKIIPFLMPLTIENGLTIVQFNKIFNLLREMVNRVESEHRVKVEQLNAISQERDAVNPVANAVSSANEIDLESIFAANDLAKDSSSGLSMDAKQRMIKQQENAERFGTQKSPMTPTPAAAKTVSQTKDLTSTLFESNLANLAVSNKPAYQTPSQNFTPTFPPAPSFGNSFTSPVQSFNWGQTNNLQSIKQPTGNFSQPMFNNFQSNSMGLPVMSTPPQTQNSVRKPLSSSDINDLLS